MNSIDLLRTVCDRMRYDMLLRISRSGGMSVGELVRATGRTQPLVSHHLKILRECGVVWAERDGRKAIYRMRGRDVERAVERVGRTAAELRKACR